VRSPSARLPSKSAVLPGVTGFFLAYLGSHVCLSSTRSREPAGQGRLSDVLRKAGDAAVARTTGVVLGGLMV
jgi:hypothetical protein